MTENAVVLDGLDALVLDADPVPRLSAGWLLGFASAHTRRAYETDLRAWLGFCSSHRIDPLTARRAHVDAWARSLELERSPKGRPLSDRTIARRLASVSSWYGYLVAEDVVASAPTTYVRRPNLPDRGETPGLTKDELQRLLSAAENAGNARALALFTLLATTGLRVNEALSRDVEHLGVDYGHRVLHIERKGGRGDRTVLAPLVLRTLDAYLNGRDSGPLFVTRSGARMDQPAAWRTVRMLARRAVLDGAGEISNHSLRVSFVTGAREAGVSLEDVQDAAGHADPRTTRRYDRGRYSLDRHAAYKVAGWISEH